MDFEQVYNAHFRDVYRYLFTCPAMNIPLRS